MKINLLFCIVALSLVFDAAKGDEIAYTETDQASDENIAKNAIVSQEPDETINIKVDEETTPNTANEEESQSSSDNIINITKDIIKDRYSQNASKGNSTLDETAVTNSTRRIYIDCLTDRSYGTVEVVNATRLMELLKLAAPANRTEVKNDGNVPPRTCLLVLFYARWCIFSSQAAPHFNALPRFFPHIKAVAIDASKYQNFNTQFGIVGVPTMMFIYNGKPLVKFNDSSYTLEMFARFVTTYTALEANGSLYVTSADFGGPVQSTPSNEIDYCLVLSWMFIAACAIYFLFQSRWWRQFVELVQNTWRESNAQHEHAD